MDFGNFFSYYRCFFFLIIFLFQTFFFQVHNPNNYIFILIYHIVCRPTCGCGYFKLLLLLQSCLQAFWHPKRRSYNQCLYLRMCIIINCIGIDIALQCRRYRYNIILSGPETNTRERRKTPPPPDCLHGRTRATTIIIIIWYLIILYLVAYLCGHVNNTIYLLHKHIHNNYSDMNIIRYCRTGNNDMHNKSITPIPLCWYTRLLYGPTIMMVIHWRQITATT